MRINVLLILILLLGHCSKSRTVLISGDHICVNKSEAEQYFEENLTLEIKIINNENKNYKDLVELNLNKSQEGDKEIKVFSKRKTDRKLKILSNKEKKEIRQKVKNKKIDNKRITKRSSSEKNLNKEKKLDNKSKNVVDVCSILKDCNIEEISNYLINKGKNKKFPDITTRQ